MASIGPPGPPQDFHNQQTRYRDYGGPPPGGSPATDPTYPEIPPGQQQPPEPPDPLQETEPTPWYRKPAGIIGWIIAVSILIGLIVYGIMELIGGGEGTTYAPSTSATPTTITTTTPPAATTSEPSTMPPTSSAAEPPAQAPTQEPTGQPTQQPTHRRHLPLPRLPSVITIPGMPNPVTLPPGLPY